MNDENWKELKALHDAGLAIHWLHPKSKRPIENKWTTGDRKSWADLKRGYKTGFNVGVRLGSPSRVTTPVSAKPSYLGVIDCDVKSTDPKHLKEMESKLGTLITTTGPQVVSGRGNGSRHLYVLSEKPLTPTRYSQSAEKVKIKLPSVKPSNADRKALTEKELAQGLRLRAAWEISIMGENQQVVLPPSIHPDTGKPYRWKKRVGVSGATGLPSFTSTIRASLSQAKKASGNATPSSTPFHISSIDVMSDPRIPESLADLILNGEGVTDRSASLFVASKELARAGLNENEILTVLSDRDTFLGACAYDHTGSRSRERAVNWLRRYTTVKGASLVRDEADEVMGSFSVITDEQAAQELEAAFGDAPVGEDWKDRIERTSVKDGARPLCSLKNVLLILRNVIDGKLLKRNRFLHGDAYAVDTPWGGKDGVALRDTDVNLIREWLTQHFHFEPSPMHIKAALDVIAEKNAFHPVQDYLNSLPPWDGVERLDTWLKTHFEAKGPDEYLAQVFRKWMTAAVTRIFQPGAQFDWMLIFEGVQGTGKSTFFRNLAGADYFSDWLDDMKSKDAAQGLRGVWIHEMGELASLKKTEIETVKAFISRRTDRYRPTHGVLEIVAPRQCVFAGSTNKSEYLRDDTGNRRFVIVQVGDKINYEANDRDRDQLWAEALVLYRLGESLELEGMAKEYAAKLQQRKMVKDDSHLMKEILIDWKNKKAVEGSTADTIDISRFKLLELFEDSGPLANRWKFGHQGTYYASIALKALGAKKWVSSGLGFWGFK